MRNNMSNEDIVIIYDKECPACNNYCQIVRIRENIGALKIINARDDSKIMDEITEKGMDIDQGMVLKMGSNYYYGSDAIYMLASMSSRSDVFNRLNFWFFKSKMLSRIFYPILRYFRNLLLKILGKSKINNLNKKSNDWF